jgi:hypothetical protein
LKDIPLGAVGLYTFCQKLGVGLKQLMAGSRNFRLNTMSRGDLISLTEEAAKVTGIPYLMDAGREEAMSILEANSTTRIAAVESISNGNGKASALKI